MLSALYLCPNGNGIYGKDVNDLELDRMMRNDTALPAALKINTENL